MAATPPPRAPHPIPEGYQGDTCPVDHSSRKTWTNLATGGPLQSLKGKGKGKTEGLSTEKQVSSIPRGELGSSTTSGEDDKWVYPSEAQFYAALMRKHSQSSASTTTTITSGSGAVRDMSSFASHGDSKQRNNDTNGNPGVEGDVEVDGAGKAITNQHHVKLPEKRDMSVVVPIHNAVNERTWGKILEWEADRGGNSCGGIRLVSFRGDSRKLSPKARWNILLGYQRPFDRHDWVVDRCGMKVRYVIDYYTGRMDGRTGNPFSFYIDARPALDSWEGVKMRLGGIWRSLRAER